MILRFKSHQTLFFVEWNETEQSLPPPRPQWTPRLVFFDIGARKRAFRVGGGAYFVDFSRYDLSTWSQKDNYYVIIL